MKNCSKKIRRGEKGKAKSLKPWATFSFKKNSAAHAQAKIVIKCDTRRKERHAVLLQMPF